jgi:hypothetical protein
MAGSGLQKAIYPKESLPTVMQLLESQLLGYYVRYRIISEDRKRFSHWSPVYEVPNPYGGEVSVIFLDGGEES